MQRAETPVCAARALLAAGEDPLSLEILVAHAAEGEASLLLVYNGRWPQANGTGTDWTRAREAYDAAQVELPLEGGRFQTPCSPQ